jgi:hypothetical protein
MVSKNEQIFIDRIKSGELEVRGGEIWRLKVRVRGGVKNIKPRRAEVNGSGGYFILSTTIDSKNVQVKAHRIVWIMSNGPIPKGLEINHKNGIKIDNRLENMELTTHGGNMRHSNIYLHPQKGECNFNSRLLEDDVRIIISRIRSGDKQTEIASDFSVSSSMITLIKKKANWAYLWDE